MSSISIFYGSVYGNAQNVAQEAESHLAAKGINAKIIEEPSVDDFLSAENILVISSTTGQGDIPPNLEWAMADLETQTPSLEGKTFVVAALGDSSYGDSYCGAGKHIFELLTKLKASAVAELFEIDGLEVFEPEDKVVAWLDSLTFPQH